MKLKYQIFISSTFEDLKDVREQIIKCILEMGHIPVGMEMFSAGNEEQWRIIQKQIDECDYYAVIIAHRYGSMDFGISYTEKEYDYAISKDIPILGFVIDENAKWSMKFIDKDEQLVTKLKAFKEKVKTKMVSFWKGSEDIYGKFAVAIGKAISSYERPGYVRANEVANIDVYTEVTRLSNENSKLREQIIEINKENIKNEEQKEIDLIKALELNKRKIPIKFKDTEKGKWNNDNKISLRQLFEIIAERMLIEADEDELKKAIALGASGRTDYQSDVPVPNNRFKEWMADLNALGLIEQSHKNHILADKNQYWSLSENGKMIFTNFRKLKLMQGIIEKPDVEIIENDEEK